MQIVSRPEPWDAIVVGSGANGGAAARQLTAAGMRVLLLEAGRAVEKRSDYGSFLNNASRGLYRHLFTRNQQVQKSHPTYWNTNPDFFVDDLDNPYSTPPDKPFHWIRGRQLGGRTLTWDAVTPRLSDFEFKAARCDGLGPDWPIGHDELAPYYADFERLLGVHGSRDGLPELPDGEFLAPQPMTPAEVTFKERVEKRFPDRRVISSRGLLASRQPARGQNHSTISSLATTIAAAAATGRLTIRSQAIVAALLFTPDGSRATGVQVIDALTRKEEELRARVVFLCASTIETLRILLNSRCSAHPAGLGGSSGVLGRYVMDHSAGNIYFYLPAIPNSETGHPLSGSQSILIPRYQNLGAQRESYARGFGMWGGIQRLPMPEFLRKQRGVAFGFLCARSEVLPDFNNHVRLDPMLRDAWGIPAAHIDCEWKPRDLELAAAAREATEELVETVGGKVVALTEVFHTPFVSGLIRRMEKEWRLSTPGMFAHEVGGARMGTDPRDSVVNSYGQCWDAMNVFVTDGACWPTSGWQNPTLTEMAITARGCDRAVAELKRGVL